MKTRLADLGAGVFTMSPAEFELFIAGETDTWAEAWSNLATAHGGTFAHDGMPIDRHNE